MQEDIANQIRQWFNRSRNRNKWNNSPIGRAISDVVRQSGNWKRNNTSHLAKDRSRKGWLAAHGINPNEPQSQDLDDRMDSEKTV